MSDRQDKTSRTEQGIFLFRSGTASLPVRRAQQAIAGVLALAMLPLSMGSALAQDYSAPPPPPDANYGPPQGGGYQALGPDQLNQLVAPIALYPDSLVAQILAASTYPAQVASAEQFIQGGGNYPPEQLAQMADSQPWDPSVKALVAFPQVVANLNQNMNWTTQLGNAYYNQPQDVMSAVQAMRQRAYAAGTLRSGSQLAVEYAPGDIVIQPVSPAVVYVPYYNPWVVYGAPIPVYSGYYYGPPRGIGFGAGLAIGFGVGIAIGAFAHFAWGFHSWAPNWGSRTVLFNHNTYISRSVTVINHGSYGGFDRNPQARAFNQQQAARFGGGNRTINNVTINRGGNTYNRGGNTFNNGGNTVNRGGNTFNGGGNSYNRGGQTYNGGNSYNRGGQAPTNAGARPGGFGQQPGNAAVARPQGGYGQAAGGARPQGGYAQGGGARPQAAPQQHSSQGHAPKASSSHESHGGGGGHEDHHR